MSSWRELVLTLALWATGGAHAAGAAGAAGSVSAPSNAYPGIGRAATPKELAAWDIDVRPDFKGLPKGAGSVAKGMQVWESKCSSCHGIFGESNEVFSPIVGGTSKDDIKTGRVARLNDPSFPGRTTLMKVASLSTLWDYINRAMPWAQPKSLSIEEVYAVTAYILNLADVLPDNFILSDKNIAEVQQRLPNRNGSTTAHALWPGAALAKRKPDVLAAACMTDCAPAPALASFLPDFARDAHGNLSEQNRAVGAQHGADTRKPVLAESQLQTKAGMPPVTMAAAPAASAALATTTALAPQAARPAAAGGAAAAIALTQKYGCQACHGLDSKLIGPTFREVAKKYAARNDGVAYLAGKIKAGGSGVWGAMPMPAQPVSAADANLIAQWLVDGARK